MKKDKIIQKPGKKETSIVRSSAAEYLTFVAASGKGGVVSAMQKKRILGVTGRYVIVLKQSK